MCLALRIRINAFKSVKIAFWREIPFLKFLPDQQLSEIRICIWNISMKCTHWDLTTSASVHIIHFCVWRIICSNFDHNTHLKVQAVFTGQLKLFIPFSVSCPGGWAPGWCGWTPSRVFHGVPWQSLSAPSTSPRLCGQTGTPIEWVPFLQNELSPDLVACKRVPTYHCRARRQSDCWEWSSF